MTALQAIKAHGRRWFPRFYAIWVRREKEKIPEIVAKILQSEATPKTCDETTFNELQRSWKPWWPPYNYDEYSTWERGCGRVRKMLEFAFLQKPGLDILEVGCGDGMAGAIMASYGHRVHLCDLTDWRDERSRGLAYTQVDLCSDLPFADNAFDFIYSYNTFEHVDDPAKALSELVRSCKRGGHIYLDFNPLYASPLGLHAMSFHMPYPQFLFSEALIDEKLREIGNCDLGYQMGELQHLNRWRVDQFRKLWQASGCEILLSEESRDFSHLDFVVRYGDSFTGRGLKIDDLAVYGVRVLLKKTLA
jgi:SAM-dependent methyltransferase